MEDSKYTNQAQLVVHLLPLIARENTFALKGGTAINFFLRDLPRLSVDIDLCFLPKSARQIALRDISNGLSRVQAMIKKAIPNAKVQHGGKERDKLVITTPEAQAKVEVNTLLRGNLYPCEQVSLSKKAEQLFHAGFSVQCISRAEIFGGKLCAAFDRQHPRDFFDLKLLLEAEGITEDIRKAFVVYLASHDRPMSELLQPTWQDLEKSFVRDFSGMTDVALTAADLLSAGIKANKLIREQLTENERLFLLSVKEGNPNWPLLGIPNAEDFPGIGWKVLNIRKMDPAKRQKALGKLKSVLQL